MTSSVYFQIGTNNGNDQFRQKVLQAKPDLVILVEPNSSLIDQIKKNYNGIPNVHIYNNAIYSTNDEIVTLYIPSKQGIMTEGGGVRADNGHTYGHGNFSLVPMNDWGKKEDMAKFTAKSITFDEICSRHNITNIEYLQIDTEGFDSEIIKMIDLSKYTIRQIRFEKWNFKQECFTDYNSDLANELGVNGMNLVKSKLLAHKYNLRDISDVDGDDIIATLV
jgi:FkbM family methyltransferase